MRFSQLGARVKGQGGALHPLALTPLFLAFSCLVLVAIHSAATAQLPTAEPMDQATEILKIDRGLEVVRAHCSGCHSLALVAQNRMSRKGWQNTIRWMQEKQGLWDLGEAEAVILDYLERNYGVTERPWRRKPLDLQGSE